MNTSVDFARPIVVQEGRHVRLRCPATGTPKPLVEWRRTDLQTTRIGAYDGKKEILLAFFCHDIFVPSNPLCVNFIFISSLFAPDLFVQPISVCIDILLDNFTHLTSLGI